MKENKKPQNPNAFPYVIPGDEKKGWDADVVDGMTLRDYFAAKEMQGMVSNPNIKIPDEADSEFDSFSERAYRYSDAMLKQREK